MTHVPDLAEALADRYELAEPLGAGGMASVYRALDRKHGRAVAIKVLHPHLQAAIGPARFLQEIRTTARLQHPHILPLLDSGDTGRHVFYVMPLVEGETLRARIDRDGALPAQDAVRLLKEVAGALQYAHEQDIIHRDIKPENILLSRGHAVVADFGIARAAASAGSEQLTGTGVSIGTPAYMSPEQVAADGALDHRSDQYSLGCMAWEMLAGRPPFAGPPAAVMAKHLTEAPPPLSAARPGVTRGIAAAVDRAMSKSPEARFDSVAAFAAALDAKDAPPADLSILVLPFANLSPDPDNAYFADGLTDEVITDLSKVRALRVISRNSALQLKGTPKDTGTLSREFNVRYVLEGSVRRAASALRITAQLSEGRSGATLWADKYGGTLEDVFELQERLSRAIVGALKVAITPAEDRRLGERAVRNPRALELFLRARAEMWKMDRPSCDLAVRLADEASALEGPNTTLLGLRGGLIVMYLLMGDPEGPLLSQLESIASQALALEPDNADALWLQGVVHIKRAEPRPALRYTGKAVELAPHNPDALFMRGWAAWQVGHPDGLTAFRAMCEVDPLNGSAASMHGLMLVQLGRNEQGIAELARGVDLSPRSFWLAMLQGFALALAGTTHDAIAALEQSRRLNPETEEFGICDLLAAGLRGDRAGVERALTEYVAAIGAADECSAYAIAAAFARVGDPERCVEWMRRSSLIRGWIDYPFWSERDTLVSRLASHPAYQSVLREIEIRWQAALGTDNNLEHP